MPTASWLHNSLDSFLTVSSEQDFDLILEGIMLTAEMADVFGFTYEPSLVSPSSPVWWTASNWICESYFEIGGDVVRVYTTDNRVQLICYLAGGCLWGLWASASSKPISDQDLSDMLEARREILLLSLQARREADVQEETTSLRRSLLRQALGGLLEIPGMTWNSRAGQTEVSPPSAGAPSAAADEPSSTADEPQSKKPRG